MTTVVLPDRVHPGLSFPVRFAVSNSGTAAAAGSRVRIYLSPDPTRSADDVLLRTRWVEPIAPGASQWHTLGEIVPDTVKPGAYYLLLVLDADDVVSEVNERNNVTASAVVVVKPTPIPDLVTTGVSIPAVLTRGVEFPVRFNVANKGTGASQPSRLRIYLSPDRAMSSSDVILRSRGISSLPPGTTQAHAVGEIIPLGVKPGSYYVLLVVDTGGVVNEYNEGNNTAAVAVTVR
jgi:subtilase family serine protease